MPKNIFKRFKYKKCFNKSVTQRYKQEFYIDDYLIKIDFSIDSSGSLCVCFDEKEIANADVHFYFPKSELKRIHVMDEYRLKGIGTLVIELIFEWCKEHKIKEMKVHPCSSSSKELFEKGLSKGLPQEELVAFYKHRGFTEERNDGYLYASIKKIEKCNLPKMKKEIRWE